MGENELGAPARNRGDQVIELCPRDETLNFRVSWNLTPTGGNWRGRRGIRISYWGCREKEIRYAERDNRKRTAQDR
jgi:hypothetical protein